MLYKFLKLIAYILEPILAPTKVIGLENIKNKKSFIVACNHQNFLDIILIGVKLKQTIYFMAKQELNKKNKFNDWFLKTMHAFYVKRGTADVAAIKRAINILKENKVICIFPQGTRIKDTSYIERSSVHGGVAMVAIYAKADIIPMMFTKPPRFFHRNILLIGEKVPMENFYGKKLTNETLDTVSDILTEKMNSLMFDFKGEKAAYKNESNIG